MINDQPSNTVAPTLALPKPLIGFFNWLLPMVVMSAFPFAAITSIFMLMFPIPGLLAEIPLILIILFAGTQVMRHQALEARQKAIDQVRIQEAAGAEITAKDAATAQRSVPSYNAMLKRNAIIAVFHVPAVAVITFVAFQMLRLLLDFGRNSGQSKDDAVLLLRLLIIVPVYGWLFTVQLSWRRIGKLVDNRLLRPVVEPPQSFDAVTMDAVSVSNAPTPSNAPRPRRVWTLVATLLGGLLAFGFAMIPYLLIAGLQSLGLPGIVTGIASIMLLIVFLGFGIFGMPRLFMFFAPRLLGTVVAREVGKVATPEETATVRQAVVDAQTRQQRAFTGSTEVRTGNRLIMIMLGFAGVVLVGAIMVASAARSQGMDAKAVENVTALELFIGLFVILGGTMLLGRLFMPKSKAITLLKGWEENTRRGDYATAIAIVDHAMEALPNWETQIPGATVYAQAGRVDDAERIVRQVLNDTAQSSNKASGEMHKQIMGLALWLLGDLYVESGRLDEADETIQRALQLDQKDFKILNTAAKLELHRRHVGTASAYRKKAVAAFGRLRKEPLAYHLGLDAWIAALQGDTVQAEALLSNAFKHVKPDSPINEAEIHIMSGYIARVQKQSMAARSSFRKAIDLDPNGFYGIVGRRELDSNK